LDSNVQSINFEDIMGDKHLMYQTIGTHRFAQEEEQNRFESVAVEEVPKQEVVKSKVQEYTSRSHRATIDAINSLIDFINS
jgi:hypothetical protein